jgi:hypothetical protein
MPRRKPTRIYHVGENRMVQIEKDYSMKFGQYLYRVCNWPDDGHTLLMAPTFAEARQFVRDGAVRR